jgi:hypothetical protein
MTKLLVAIAYDMNNGVYLLYFAIIEEERNSNWSWFLDLFHRYVIGSHIGLYIISDRYVS